LPSIGGAGEEVERVLRRMVAWGGSDGLREVVNMECRNWVWVLGLCVGGCVGGAGDAGLGRNHPANPEAAEAPLPLRSEILAGGGMATTQSASTLPATSAPSAMAYVCPMHAQVVSDRPGSCPICHMKLVPNKGHEHMERGARR